MKQIQPELHRLGVLQRQILKWIRLEGGGCLPVSVLFTSLYNSQTYPDPIAMTERMAEAVEQLSRIGLIELRFDPPSKSKWPSLYDFGGVHKNLVEGEDGKWLWKSGNCPEVALTDFGNHYVAKMA